MEVPRRVMIKTLVPRLPGMVRLIIANKLSLSPCSDKQDGRVELIVYIIRAFLTGGKSVRVLQEDSLRDSGVKGRIWISKVTAPVDNSASMTGGGLSVRDAVVKAIEVLGDGTEQYLLPDLKEIEAEWTGFRADANKKSTRVMLRSEEEHYRRLMKEVTSDVTVLYLHGGAYIMLDPSTHRTTTGQLAEKTGGRCLSVRYRLAPQNPFPAALVDALTMYLYLLAPPEGSYHEPVPASKIVFAGDSAGGNLATVLMLLLVTLKKSGVTSFNFHGKQVPLEIPAGLAANSPWCDISRSLPSVWTNAKYDYLDPPNDKGLPLITLPPDEIWPSSPPRAEMFCTASMLTHPIVSPVLAKPEHWQGLPPVFICGGTEGLSDEYLTMARNMYLGNTTVVFEGYQGMPHCFAMVLPMIPQSKDCMDKWAKFCVDVVNTPTKLERKSTATWWVAKTANPPKYEHVDLAEMGLTDELVREKILRVKGMATEREHKDLDAWNTKHHQDQSHFLHPAAAELKREEDHETEKKIKAQL